MLLRSFTVLQQSDFDLLRWRNVIERHSTVNSIIGCATNVPSHGWEVVGGGEESETIKYKETTIQ
jgi:hypothetical protein